MQAEGLLSPLEVFASGAQSLARGRHPRAPVLVPGLELWLECMDHPGMLGIVCPGHVLGHGLLSAGAWGAMEASHGLSPSPSTLPTYRL